MSFSFAMVRVSRTINQIPDGRISMTFSDFNHANPLILSITVQTTTPPAPQTIATLSEP